MISIITPVLFFDNNLKNLYVSIINQTRLEYFEWIIIKESKKVYKRKDFVLNKSLKLVILYSNKKKIYSAINTGIKYSKFKYYIVIGQDDTFNRNIFKIFLENVYDNVDIFIYQTTLLYAAPIPLNKKKFFGNILYETNHSGGMIFAKKIHNIIGNYDENFKIASDQLFIKQAIQKFTFKKYAILSSVIGNTGVTSKNKKLSLVENFKVDLKLNNVTLHEVIFFLYRYLKFTFKK